MKKMKTAITRTLTIGQGVSIHSYSTKQQGYGRQSLFVELAIDLNNCDEIADLELRRSAKDCVIGNTAYIKNVYVKDVFPNVLEQYQDSYYLRVFTAYDQDRDIYTRDSGDGEYTDDCLFDTIQDLLNHVLDGDEVEVEFELEQEYIIEWESNGNNEYRYIDNEDSQNGTSNREQAKRFDSREEAQEYININCGGHCFVSEYYI